MNASTMSDTELLRASLAGNRRAFAGIVERYKSLVSAVAYSATGDLELSEDLAQETFVTAWIRLANVKDPRKLRSWLAGIARNLAMRALRRKQRDVMAHAKALDGVGEPPASNPSPREMAISKEEQTVLWQSLQQIPENYRIPLIMYYREGQSVLEIAQSLSLSTDAVKQRLVRGRRTLRDELAVFVEAALERARPKRNVTSAVLLALPSARLAALGATVKAVGSMAMRALGGTSVTQVAGAVAVVAAVAVGGFLFSSTVASRWEQDAQTEAKAIAEAAVTMPASEEPPEATAETELAALGTVEATDEETSAETTVPSPRAPRKRRPRPKKPFAESASTLQRRLSRTLGGRNPFLRPRSAASRDGSIWR
ncbi:MAG TPA: sigma-70 family RNA polymerase sigma factor [Candidatus Hydrogenedentes bacterium]|nr:sigma-70 family RNA polymerase sigma factor [Candidatus Hydrogenedentota bacterium]HIJ74639.1 sigma-70 family RNA polymerase sigma factor [Candidatus Hydrogenedentota bacterium]